MSGGFFRGTSAEQDTRFSNKQAKLMKSQKFAPELENLVDMTKVKMDVLRPWIANRVTEFIGFEDEVLINFIYGLLEGKVVNGKEIQISLTGFMERNTGKFMKELWVLLLSAQNNASGVPQQFLDAKEEESKKKKAETDRLANEIQRRKDQENRELEQETHKRMDAGNGVSKDSVEPSTKDLQTDLVPKTDLVPRTDLVPKTDTQKQYEGKNGFQGRRSSRSPLSADRSSPRGRRLKPASRSISNSKSNSKSRSRSVSISPKWRRRPNPSENRVPPRVSQSPYRHSPRRSLTPARRRSSYYRRRSISQSPPRYRMRSPVRRRSRSPLRRRSRSPMRRRSRSPVGPRSRSPIGRRSPIDRSLSPVRARSPITRRRSPAAVYRRSPMRYNRSPSPWRRRNRGSPMLKRRSPSPLLRSTSVSRNRRSPSPVTRKSSLPRDLSSSSHSRSASPVRRSPPRKYRSPMDSSRERTRDQLKSSKVHDISLPSRSERASGSLKRDTSLEKNDSIEPKSTRGLRESPMLTNKGRITQSRIDSPQKEPQVEKSIKKSNAVINDNSRNDGSSSQKSSKNPSKVHKSPQGVSSFDDESSKKMSGHYHSDKTRSQQKLELNNKDEAFGSGNKVEKVDRLKIPGHQDPRMVKDAAVTRGIGNSSYTDGSGTFKKTKSRSDDIEIKDRPTETLSKSVTVREVKQKEKTVSLGSSSEESNQKRRNVTEKEKNKRPRELESENESSFDSYEEERKEAKRRKKEEKKSRKEERRRKRHERRRKREERHAMKKTLKSLDSVSSASDSEDDAGHVKRRHEDTKETEFDQKKLEMQLREKALESLRAKKGIGH